jgi:translation initiation factor 3 subunit C
LKRFVLIFSLIPLPLSLSESEDEVRVVKSAKERSLEAFTRHISNIRKAMRQKDYLTIQSEFDELSKAMVKAKKLLKEGVPRPLVRILCDLEDYISANIGDKAAFQKLSASQGRALNRMKLTLKKHNKPYQLVMKEYRKNPVVSSSSDEESEAAEEDSSSSEEESSEEESSDEEEEEVSSLTLSSFCGCCHKDVIQPLSRG